MWKAFIMMVEISKFQGKIRNKSHRDKTLQQNLESRFDNIESLNKYVMEKIHHTALRNVREEFLGIGIPRSSYLHRIWLIYLSDFKNIFNDYRVLITKASDYNKKLKQYMKEKLIFLTTTIREHFQNYYDQNWGLDGFYI